MEQILVKLLKFGVVGLSGVFIDFGITYLLKQKMLVNKYVANTAGFVVAATSNFIWNRMWTFSSNDPHISTQYLRYFACATVGVLLSNLIIWLLHEKMKMNFYVTKAFAICVVMLWNFISSLFFTFNQQ